MSPVPRRNDALDGLRALAALGVLTFHVWLYRVGDPPGARKSVSDHLLFQGNLGLICFFVLSGYLLYRAFARAALTGERADLGGYARRRLARIVPAYYACIVGSLLLYAIVGYSDVLPPSSGLPLFAVFGQNYSMDTLMKIDPVMWTLCVEAAFYLALPLLGLVAFLLGPRRIAYQAAVLVALVAATAVWNDLVHTKDLGPIASKALPAYLGHFALGMLVALWIEGRRLRRGAGHPFGPRLTAALMAAGVGLVAWNAYVYEVWSSESFSRVVLAKLPTALGFALVVAAAAGGSGPSVAWLRARLLVAVGIVSYGVYLWHLPLILVVRKLGLLPSAIGPRFVVVLALALSMATLSWKLLERPLIERAASRRGRARGLRPAEVQAAP
ncbi:MAG: acyltransferase family protein [Thermoleophilaceae bacterium]